MYLGNPLLPIKITLADATLKLNKEIQKKNWYEFELTPLKLTLVPYFLFNYHYYIENENEGKNVIKSTVHGILAVDGHEIKIRTDLVEVLKHNWKNSMQEIPRGEFSERYCNIDKNDQIEVLKLKTAQHFNVPKVNVVVSEPRKLLLPEYWAVAKIGEKKYDLTVNAIDGSLGGIKEIPERQKGYMELTKETFNELKNPKSWFMYSAQAIKELISFTAPTKNKSNKNHLNNNSNNTPKMNLSIFESRGVLLLIILLAILLITASIFRIKFF
jgi:hypothetical protein